MMLFSFYKALFVCSLVPLFDKSSHLSYHLRSFQNVDISDSIAISLFTNTALFPELLLNHLPAFLSSCDFLKIKYPTACLSALLARNNIPFAQVCNCQQQKQDNIDKAETRNTHSFSQRNCFRKIGVKP